MIPHASDDRFRVAYNRLVDHVTRRYGVPLQVRDVPDPFTGDLNGVEIEVDYDLEPADALFIAAHLVGHTIQWNVTEDNRRIGLLAVPVPCQDDAMLAALERYERDAACYSLQLLHDAGIADLDQWFSDYAECDVQYLLAYYRTGVKREMQGFWVDGTRLVTPTTIPACTFARWVDSRNGGVVL